MIGERYQNIKFKVERSPLAYTFCRSFHRRQRNVPKAWRYLITILVLFFVGIKLFTGLTPLHVQRTVLIASHSTPGLMLSADNLNGTATNRIYQWTPEAVVMASSLLSQNAFVVKGKHSCFREGFNETDSFGEQSDGCPCKTGWFGSKCSVPDVIRGSAIPWNKNFLAVRSVPRLIIQAFPFSHEWEMLELRFAEIGDVVDVFLILESNYTAHGDPKPLRLLERLQQGHFPEIARKIIHIFLDYFPDGGHKNGWLVDELHRDYLGIHGLKMVPGLKESDLYIQTDADEIPSRETLLFLKWHDGYSEPIAINMRWTLYTYFWTLSKKSKQIFVGVTIGILVHVFHGKP